MERLASTLAFAFALTLATGAPLPRVARAEITVAVLEGDVIPGLGTVKWIWDLAINDSGDWLVEAVVNVSPGVQTNVLIWNGSVYLRGGDPLPEPRGATITTALGGGFHAMSLNNQGDAGFIFILDGTQGGNDDDVGLYFETSLVLQEGELSIAPELPPGKYRHGPFDVRVHPGDSNQLVIFSDLVDELMPDERQYTILRVTHDGAGNLTSESVLRREGEIAPGLGQAIAYVVAGAHKWAVNDLGQVLHQVNLDDPGNTGVIYLNDTILALEGRASPVSGRSYEDVTGWGMDVNNAGSYVFKARLDGDDADDDLIVKNGSVFVRQGDALPAIAPWEIVGFGAEYGPVQIDDGGNVFFYASWDDPNQSTNTGLFFNDQLVVQEGVTTVDGQLITYLSLLDHGFELSNNGRYAIFEGSLDWSLNGAFIIELQPPTSVAASALEASPALALITPNPFVQETELRFFVPRGGQVSLAIFDVSGRRVRELSATFVSGEHAVSWDGRDDDGVQVPAGVYFVRFAMEGVQTTRKVVRLGHWR